MHPVRWPVVDFHDHFAQPVLRLHTVQFAGDQQTVDNRCTFSTTIRTEEQVIFSSNRHRSQCVFTDVVVYFHPAVTTELVQCLPLLQDIVERLRHLRMFRQRFPLQLYPVVQRLHQRDTSGFPDRKPFVCRTAAYLCFYGVQLCYPSERFELWSFVVYGDSRRVAYPAD